MKQEKIKIFNQAIEKCSHRITSKLTKNNWKPLINTKKIKEQSKKQMNFQNLISKYNEQDKNDVDNLDTLSEMLKEDNIIKKINVMAKINDKHLLTELIKNIADEIVEDKNLINLSIFKEIRIKNILQEIFYSEIKIKNEKIINYASLSFVYNICQEKDEKVFIDFENLIDKLIESKIYIDDDSYIKQVKENSKILHKIYLTEECDKKFELIDQIESFDTIKNLVYFLRNHIIFHGSTNNASALFKRILDLDDVVNISDCFVEKMVNLIKHNFHHKIHDNFNELYEKFIIFANNVLEADISNDINLYTNLAIDNANILNEINFIKANDKKFELFFKIKNKSIHEDLFKEMFYSMFKNADMKIFEKLITYKSTEYLCQHLNIYINKIVEDSIELILDQNENFEQKIFNNIKLIHNYFFEKKLSDEINSIVTKNLECVKILEKINNEKNLLLRVKKIKDVNYKKITEIFISKIYQTFDNTSQALAGYTIKLLKDEIKITDQHWFEKFKTFIEKLKVYDKNLEFCQKINDYLKYFQIIEELKVLPTTDSKLTMLINIKDKYYLDVLNNIIRDQELWEQMKAKKLTPNYKTINPLLNHKTKNRSIRGLNRAIIKNDAIAVEALINYGADLDFIDKTKFPPMYHAIKSENLEIINLLIEKMKDYPLQKNILRKIIKPDNQNYLTIAINLKNDKIIDKLLEQKAIFDLDWQTSKGNTALSLAIKNKNFVLADKLISLGYNVNFINKFGKTLYTEAIIKNLDDDKNNEEINFLKKHGATLSCRNEKGKNPLQLAWEKDDKSYYNKLITAAKINNADEVEKFLKNLEIHKEEQTIIATPNLTQNSLSLSETQESNFWALQSFHSNNYKLPALNANSKNPVIKKKIVTIVRQVTQKKIMFKILSRKTKIVTNLTITILFNIMQMK